MSNGLTTLEYEPDEEEGARYGDQAVLLYYEHKEGVTPGDTVDIVDSDDDRLGGGTVAYVLRTPIHRLPTLTLDGLPEFDNIDDAVAYFEAEANASNIQSSDIISVIGLYNVRWVGGYV